MLEWVRYSQVQRDGIIAQLKRLNNESCMARAVYAGIAIIEIIVLLKRAGRGIMRINDTLVNRLMATKALFNGMRACA
jgi:hypothetical protein